MDIIRLFESKKTFKKELFWKAISHHMNQSCDSIVGEGYFSRVLKPNLSTTLNGQKIVLKVDKNPQERFFDIDETQDTVVIKGNSFLIDVILLTHFSLLWDQTPHVLRMYGYSFCDGGFRLILEMCGLDKPVNVPLGDAYQHLNNVHPSPESMSLYMNTLQDVLEFPPSLGSFNINLDPLLDYFVISFLHTTWLLWTKLKITLFDQYPRNIFLKFDPTIKTIYYQIKDDMCLKVDTQGIIFKLGDVSLAAMSSDKLVVHGAWNKEGKLTPHAIGKWHPSYLHYLQEVGRLYATPILRDLLYSQANTHELLDMETFKQIPTQLALLCSKELFKTFRVPLPTVLESHEMIVKL